MRNLFAVVFSLLFLAPVWANDYYNADYNEQKDTYVGIRIHKNESLSLKYEAEGIDGFRLREDNFGIGAVAGNRLSDNVKVEFETAYNGMKELGNNTTLSVDVWANMFNVYMFQQFDGAVEPYAGLGIGFAAIWGSVNAPYVALSDSVFDLSFQIMLGVNFALNDRVDLNLGLKYQYYGEVEFKQNNAEVAKIDVDGTEFYFGAVYKFSL
ncbi:MAG: porin family protein [Alphaproteobacteria bacterium]|nr:porin family protein [Alphaproteobacteria bacterium]